MSKKRYELLQEGDVIQQGDEYLGCDGWNESSCVGKPVGHAHTTNFETGQPFLYRRTLSIPATEPVVKPEATPDADSPGEGYRLLGSDEVVLGTDEYKGKGPGYRWVEPFGFQVGCAVREVYPDAFIYRRKIVPVTVPAPEPARPPLPEGYRFLEVGEERQEGDLWIGKDDWKTGDTWTQQHAAGRIVSESDYCYFARKKEAATPQAPACPLRRMGGLFPVLQWFDGKNWMDVPWESAKVTTVKPTTATGGDL